MHRAIQPISLILLICLSFVVHTADRQKISFAFFADPNSDVSMKWVELIYSDAFSQLNVDFSFIVVPALRASRMVDLGKVDGEPIRTATYGDTHPNLIRINQPLGEGTLSAFTHDPSIKIDSWKDMENQNYNIEYYRGIALAKQRLSQYITPDRLSDSSSPAQSLRKMLRGRIDIYIGATQLTTGLLNTPEFTNNNIQMIATLEDLSSYGYLNKKHSELAVKLAEVLHQMKSTGLFKTYFNQAKHFIDLQTPTTNLDTEGYSH